MENAKRIRMFESLRRDVFSRAFASSALKALMLSLVFALWPWEVFAADKSSTLGTLLCHINSNLGPYPKIVNAIAYIAGSFFAVKSVLLFRKHAENSAQPQIVSGVAHFIAAGFLLSFPTFIGVVQTSLFGKDLSGTKEYICAPGAVAQISGSVGLDQMMQNFVKSIYQPTFLLLSLICVAVGLTFILGGLLRAAKTGTDPRAADPKSIVAHLVFGAILISIGTVLPDVLKSIFGTGDISNMSSITLISWSKITGSSVDTKAADNTVRAVLAFIQIIGGISFVRGWMILKKAVEGGGQATIPQGFTHIIGGAMAINIDIMLRTLDNTFGTGIIS